MAEGIAGEVRGAVEAHVLEEVCQSQLVLLFLYGAYLLRDVEVGPVGGLLVVADVVGQSVVQFADAHGGVGGQRGQLLLCQRRGQAAPEGEHGHAEAFQ